VDVVVQGVQKVAAEFTQSGQALVGVPLAGALVLIAGHQGEVPESVGEMLGIS